MRLGAGEKAPEGCFSEVVKYSSRKRGVVE